VVCLTGTRKGKSLLGYFSLAYTKQKRTGLSARPITGQSPKFNLKSFTFMSFRACIYQQKVTFSSDLSHGNSKQEHDFFDIFL